MRSSFRLIILGAFALGFLLMACLAMVLSNYIEITARAVP